MELTQLAAADLLLAPMLSHEIYMRRCLDLAQLGFGSTSPNPMVGCVLVHGQEIIGEGYHKRAGDHHAEVNAISSVTAPELLKQATLYVNLEPCAHHGKTPPCADLIIEHKIPRVVIANMDPNPAVAGKGIARLKEAGIEVTTGVLASEGNWLNRRFFTFHQKQRPYVILKFAQTQDGFLDQQRRKDDGLKPLKISGEEMYRTVHRWRSEEDAILVGQNTVSLDDPGLTARFWPGKQPIRLVIDPQLQVSEDRKLMSDGRHTWIFNALRSDYCENNLCYIRIDDPAHFLQEILRYLYKSDVQSVIVEGGSTTIARFGEEGLWDEARVITNPMRIGAGVPAPNLPGRLIRTESIGNDLLHTYLPQ